MGDLNKHGQKVQTSSYKLKRSIRDVTYNMTAAVMHAVACQKVTKRVNPTKFSSQGKQFLIFFPSLYEIMDVAKLTVVITLQCMLSLVIMLYTLTLYSSLCLLYLNKIGRRKTQK